MWMRSFSDSGELSSQDELPKGYQVCAASFHEVLVASGIVGVCTFQVPEDSLPADHVLPALSTALASQLDC